MSILDKMVCRKTKQQKTAMFCELEGIFTAEAVEKWEKMKLEMGHVMECL